MNQHNFIVSIVFSIDSIVRRQMKRIPLSSSVCSCRIFCSMSMSMCVHAMSMPASYPVAAPVSLPQFVGKGHKNTALRTMPPPVRGYFHSVWARGLETPQKKMNAWTNEHSRPADRLPAGTSYYSPSTIRFSVQKGAHISTSRRWIYH
jgi:hypothetical protein